MILFSYFVAREVALKRPSVETIDGTREIRDLLQSLLKEGWKEIWTWFKFSFQGERPVTAIEDRAVNVAAVGLIISLLFA